MSTGETQSTTARFTSPSSTMGPGSNNAKKYNSTASTPKSPLLNSSTIGIRNSQSRNRLIGSKISAPRPINLPSLKRESAAGTTETPHNTSSPSSGGGWGSANSSPSTSFLQNHAETHKLATSPPAHKETLTTNEEEQNSKQAPEASSPPQTASTVVRGWAVPTVTPVVIQPSSNDFPTAAEAAGKTKPTVNDDKEYLKYASSDPNHRSWDEMVSEDMDDFDVDVVEFDDGTKVQVDSHHKEEEETEQEEQIVNPADRFTEDFDRSYPPQKYQYSGYNNTRYNNSVHGHHNSNQRRQSNEDNNNTNRRWSNVSSNSSMRRDSFDNSRRQSNSHNEYHHSLLHRPRRLSEQSDLSSTHNMDHSMNPLEIIPEPEEVVIVQRELMLTAAERAKKRRDEEEAQFEAARERARQKAEALALDMEEKKKAESKDSFKDSSKDATKHTYKDDKKKASKDSSSPTKEKPVIVVSNKLPDTSKPWNIVAAIKDSNTETKPTVATTPTKILKNEKRAEEEAKKKELKEETKKVEGEPTPIPTHDRFGVLLTTDEQNWELFVNKIKSDRIVPLHQEKPQNDWNSYATRLQESVMENQAIFNKKFAKPKVEEEKPKLITEEVEYEHNEEWGNIPSHIQGHRSNNGWTRNDTSSRGGRAERGRNSRNRGAPTATVFTVNNNANAPIIVKEILKHDSPPLVPKEEKAESKHEGESNPVNKQQKVESKPFKEETKSKEEEFQVAVSKKSRITNILKESTSPIFPDFIEKMVGKKPANMSFMMDIDESDKDITMLNQKLICNSTPNSSSTTTTSPSATTPPTVTVEAISSHFPILIYQPQQAGAGSICLVPSNSHPSPQAVVGTITTTQQPAYYPPSPWEPKPTSNNWESIARSSEYHAQRFSHSSSYSGRGRFSNKQRGGYAPKERAHYSNNHGLYQRNNAPPVEQPTL